MKKWKKNLVAFAVLVTVCSGIYINWQFTEEQTSAELTDTLNGEKILSEDMLVMADGSSVLSNDSSETTINDYFAAVRLSRQEARDNAVSLLQEAFSYENGSSNIESGSQLEQIVQDALREAQIESLVIAKGYTDCVAYITDKGISVAVASPDGGLVKEDVAVITDIIMSQSDYIMEDIYVVEVQ